MEGDEGVTDSMTQAFDTLCEIMGVNNIHDVIQGVRELKKNNEALRKMLGSLSVISVVTVAGQPLFTQLPPIIPQDAYPVDILETMRDALIDGSTFLRSAIMAGKTRKDA